MVMYDNRKFKGGFKAGRSPALRTHSPLDKLYRQRHRLATAQAERCDAALAAVRAQRVQQRDQHPRAAGADRVAQRDRAAVDVQAVPVDAKLAAISDHLRREGLVDL